MVTETTDLPRRHHLTVDDYFRMAEVGILGPDDRVELIEGEIIDMPPIGPPHAGTVTQLHAVLQRAVAERAIVYEQNPAVLGRYSAPQPDLVLLAPRKDYYKSRHPRPSDMLLLVEVADSSLRYDRNVKAGLYARHAIPEYWVVDLRGKRLIRHRDPQSGAYARVDEPDLGRALEIGALPGIALELAQLFE